MCTVTAMDWDNKTSVLKWVTGCGRALQLASAELRGDREVVLAAVRECGAAISFASNELKADRDVAVAAVREDGRALHWVSEDLQNDRELVKEAMLDWPWAIAYASDALQIDKPLHRFPRTFDNLRYFWDWGMAHKRCKPALYAWLERAQIRMGAYNEETGAARKRDRAAFEADNTV